ncbi:MAG: hypothetical protein ACRD2X_24115 [Vicinamibacteraceae bacterium]
MALTLRRTTRFAMAIALLLICRTGRAQSPPMRDLDPGQVRSGMLVWQIGVNSKDGPSAMIETISRATYQGESTWRVTHYDQDPASTTVNSFDLYDLDRETLAPIRSVMRNEAFDLDLRFTPREVTLRRVAKDGGKLDERIVLKTAVQGEGPGLRLLTASLPLRPGLKFRYQQVDRWGGKGDSRVKPMTLSVVRHTRVETSFGDRDALEVVIEPDDKSFRIRSHVRAKLPYYPFDMEYVRGTTTLLSEVTAVAFEGGHD